MIRLRSMLQILPCSSILFSLVFMQPAKAVTFEWTDPASGDFDVADNWTPAGGPPTAGDKVQFNEVGTYMVAFNADEAVDQLNFDIGDVTFRSNGTDRSLDLLTGTSDAVLEGGTLTLGVANDPLQLTVGHYLRVNNGATLKVTNGSVVDANHLLMADSGNGTIVVDGSGSQFNKTGSLLINIGQTGKGSLTFQNGAAGVLGSTLQLGNNSFASGGGDFSVLSGSDVTLSILEVASSGIITTDNSVLVDGLSSSLNLTSSSTSLTIGNSVPSGPNGAVEVTGNGAITTSGATAINNSGTLTVDGGTFTSNGAVTMSAGSTLTLDGGALTAGGGLDNTAVGTLNFNDGTLTVMNGAFLPDAGGPSVGYLVDGPSAADLPHLVIGTGATATFDDDLTVGDMQRGKLTIGGGGAIVNDAGQIGLSANSTGTVTVDGAGSTWTNSSDLHVGNSGTGTLNITGGGAVTNANATLGESGGADGTATIDGAGSTWTNSGDLHVGKSGTGTLSISAGGAVTNVQGSVGEDSGANGTANVDGANSSWASSGDLHVGDAGVGTLNVSAGGEVSNASGSVGTQAGSTGTATVDGAGSTWTNTSTLDVAGAGTGTLNITGGGAVSNTIGTVGSSSGTTGIVNVTGADSTWTNSGDLLIGSAGTGTLNIAGGGAVSNDSSIVADMSNATGTVTVAGAGSNWMTSNTVSVGKAGTGTLDISGGGVVASAEGIVGENGNGTGSATVDGANSSWTTSHTLSVGKSGNGTLDVTGGGMVTDANSIVGEDANSSGVVNVDGVGSHWANTNDLTVGMNGTGSLTITNNGLVTVGGTTTIGPHGTIDLDGGRFEFGETTLADFVAINKVSGSMAGNLPNSGVTDVSTFSQMTAVDMSDVNLNNTGTLIGNGTPDTSLVNQPTGKVEVATGERMRFSGGINSGQVTLTGGQLRFAQDFTNNAAGTVVGNGNLQTGTGTTNHGHMAFSATTNVIGNVTNGATGLITSSGGTTTFFDDVVNLGEIRTNTNSFTVYAGSYSGAGDTGTGTVIVDGDLKPGVSPGTMSFNGGLSFGAAAGLEIELAGLLAGSEYDSVEVAGEAVLGGTLTVSLIDSFTPSLGDSFQIVSAGNINGKFDHELLPALDSLGWAIDYGTTSVVLSVVESLPGDFDFDGDVDGADFLAWQRGESPAPLSSADLDDWQMNFGSTASLAANSSSVPEPRTISSILILSIIGLLFVESRR